MKKISLVKTACAVALTAACTLSLAGCSGVTGGTAATVNGVAISEDEVTLSVESIRASMGVSDEESWGLWMSENGYTPEQVRQDVLDGLIDQEVLRQGAEALGVTVEQSEIDSYYDSIASQFESEAAWKEALISAGYSSTDEYRETIELSLLSEAVQATLGTTEEPSAEDMLTYAQMYASYYDGSKRSSHILFDASDEATAREVLDKINAGTLDFAAAAEQYSTDSGSSASGGDVGWDALATFVDEYQTGLDGLAKGQVSGLVMSDYGIHIIKCTDVFTAPAKVTSADQLPSEFVDSIRSMLQSSMQSEAYSVWLAEQREAAEIVINDMPTSVSYYVDMTKYDVVAEGAEGEVGAEGESADSSEASATVEGEDSETE